MERRGTNSVIQLLFRDIVGGWTRVGEDIPEDGSWRIVLRGVIERNDRVWSQPILEEFSFPRENCKANFTFLRQSLYNSRRIIVSLFSLLVFDSSTVKRNYFYDIPINENFIYFSHKVILYERNENFFIERKIFEVGILFSLEERR